ncbi:MAG: hypothetical protein RSD91_05640 [Clostridiales bacterium]
MNELNAVLAELKDLIAKYEISPFITKDYDVIIKDCWADKEKGIKCLTITFNADLDTLITEMGYITCFAEGDKLYFIKANENGGLKLTDGRFRISKRAKVEEYKKFVGCFELKNDGLKNLYYVEALNKQIV